MAKLHWRTCTAASSAQRTAAAVCGRTWKALVILPVRKYVGGVSYVTKGVHMMLTCALRNRSAQVSKYPGMFSYDARQGV
jgi:hypothetical protein